MESRGRVVCDQSLMQVCPLGHAGGEFDCDAGDVEQTNRVATLLNIRCCSRGIENEHVMPAMSEPLQEFTWLRDYRAKVQC